MAVIPALMLAACQQTAGVVEDSPSATSGGWPSDVVSASGDISLPAGFELWPTAGSWSTAGEDGVQNGMHQVYVSPGAIESFRTNGSFPDGAVLVKEVRGAATASLTTGNASYATEKQVWFVMVKDTEGRFPDNTLWGDGWGWALFEAPDPTKQVAVDYNADCKSCHLPAEDTDWIYTAAYPALWSDGIASVPSWQD